MPSPARDEYDEVRMTVNASDVLELIELAKLARTVARIMSDQGDISPTAMKLYDALREPK
jgi:hypothetical protein